MRRFSGASARLLLHAARAAVWLTVAFAIPASAADAPFQRHEMSQASLSFGYPAGFQYLEARSNASKVVYGGKISGKVVFFGVEISQQPIFSKVSDAVAHAEFRVRFPLSALVDPLVAGLSPRPTVRAQYYGTLGPLPAVVVEFTHDSTDPRRPGWSHTLYAQNRVTQWKRGGVNVILYCEPEDKDRFRPVIEQIFKSFQFN